MIIAEMPERPLSRLSGTTFGLCCPFQKAEYSMRDLTPLCRDFLALTNIHTMVSDSIYPVSPLGQALSQVVNLQKKSQGSLRSSISSRRFVPSSNSAALAMCRARVRIACNPWAARCASISARARVSIATGSVLR